MDRSTTETEGKRRRKWSALFYPVHNLGILPFSDQNTNAPTIKLNNVALK